jgi:putative tricarboxylic transport membrane protein
MQDRKSGSLALPELGLGVGLLLFAAFVLWQTWEIPVSPLYAKIGPTIFPYVATVGLAVLAVLLVVAALRGGWQPEEEKEVALDWRAIAYVAAGLVANIALITWLGFTVASTVMFALIARGFGSTQPVRDAVIGFAVALAAYFGFAKALGVNIGAGLIEQVIESALAAVIPGFGG